MYKNALNEYTFAMNKRIQDNLSIVPSSINFPLSLICHDSEVIKREIEHFGNTDVDTSQKIDNIWIGIMKEFLKLSKLSSFIQAKGSGHFIHLSKPELVWEAIENLDSLPTNKT